jgi:hypothetical protein
MTTNPYLTPEELGHLPAPKPKKSSTLLNWLIALGILALLAMMLIPAPRISREAARRASCANNLRNIWLALQTYESEYGHLPPAYTVNEAGKPLHSWRALILPYLEQQQLYAKIDLSKPWDHSVNRAAYEATPAVYHCPSSTVRRGQTIYLAAATTGGCFKPPAARKRADITDNHDLTIMVLEVPEHHAVHWMAPRDLDDDLLASLSRADTHAHPNGVMTLRVSGRMMFLSEKTPPHVVRALLSIAGNDDQVAQAAD